jgi:hypothetical protein
LPAPVLGDGEGMRAMFAAYWVLIVGGLLLYLVVGLNVE